MNDLRFGLRMLLKNPGFTAVAVLTLALGIGATTTVFSVVNGVLLKPLSYPDADRIVQVYESDPEKGFERRYTSPANFVDWRRESTVFEAISFSAEFDGQKTRSFVLAGGDGELAKRLTGRFVSTNYFSVYGVKPLLGRSFTPDEEQPGAPRTAVISHRLWQEVFAGNPDVIGQTITLENQGRHAYVVIGVLPAQPEVPGGDIFSPCHNMGRPMSRRGGAMLNVVGCLKPGVSVARAESEMKAIQSRIHAGHGMLEETGKHLVMGRSASVVPLMEATVGNIRSSLLVFSGAVLLVLLIACANAANLLLARALSRRREIAVRTALGAGRWQILRQLLVESVMLSLMGGAAGGLIGYWGLQLLIRFSGGGIPRIADVLLDPTVMGFTFLLSLSTGLIFGLAPAWLTSKSDLNESLKEGAGRLACGAAHHRLGNLFTVTQVALALVLLIGAGLLLQSFAALQQIDPGFRRADELLVVDVVMTGASYKGEPQRRSFIRQLVEQMRAAPGVESACLVSMIPDRGNGWPTPFARKDRPLPERAKRPVINTRVVTPGFLETYGIPLLRGRDISEADVGKAGLVAMINKTFAEQYYPNDDPVGKMIECGGERQIVGVIGDVKNSGLQNKTRAEIYFSYNQWENPSGFLTVRARNALALAPYVTERVRELNPNQPLTYFKTMSQYLDSGFSQARFRTFLLGVFALLALLLAGIGIYGVMAFSVGQRMGEMAIRMALGAGKSSVMLLVLRQGLRLTLAGVVLGLIGSLALTRVLESYLFNITATDTVTFLGLAVFFVLVGVLACAIPALKATRVAPNEALRCD